MWIDPTNLFAFDEFIKISKAHASHSTKEAREDFEYLLNCNKNCNKFLINTEHYKSQPKSTITSSFETLPALPFKTCMFACDSSTPLLITPGNEIIYTLLIHEISPGVYFQAGFGISDRVPGIFYWKTSDNHWVIHDLIQLVNQSKIGVEEYSEEVKIPRRVGVGHRKEIKVNKIIHIVGNKTRRTPNNVGVRSKIEWSHSWVVRGHWRKTSGVGKDREGNRVVEQFTWVIPHTKGDGELMEKIRYVNQ